jgi:molecular chaperone DnaK
MPQVEVTFDVDASGILNVKAKDKASGKEQSIRVEARSSLTADDIEKMKKDADLHAEEDKKKREESEARNFADQLIYTAEKALKDAEGKISVEIKQGVEAKVAELKQAKEKTAGAAEIKTATEALSLEMQKIGEAMNKQNQQTPPGGKTEDKKDNGPTGDGPIRDAETS